MELTLGEAMVITLRQIVDTHRKKAVITCPETCLCWEVDAIASELERDYAATGKT